MKKSNSSKKPVKSTKKPVKKTSKVQSVEADLNAVEKKVKSKLPKTKVPETNEPVVEPWEKTSVEAKIDVPQNWFQRTKTRIVDFFSDFLTF